MNLLFDIGGTNMRFAFTSGGNKINDVYICPTPGTYQAALKAFRHVMEKAPAGQKISHVIGGVPRFAKDRLTFWHTNPAQAAIQKIMKAPVKLMNDSELGALGEAHYGAGKTSKIMAYVTFSTGFGGARIVNKQIDANYFGFEPKLQIADVDGGHYPSISLQASGRGLKNKFGKPAQELTRKSIWQAVEKWMGIALNNAAVFWSPEIIIIGGAVAENEHISIARLNQFLNKRFAKMPKKPKIVKSKLGQLSGLYGALVISRSL